MTLVPNAPIATLSAIALNETGNERRSYLAGRASRPPSIDDPRMKVRMESKPQNKMITIGFLTVRHHSTHGFFGGYLIVNSLARPLEFHCTLPVQPTRAQQILYGSTLHEFVCGEQIARALVTKAKATPDVVLADTASVLTLRHIQSIPLGSIEVGVASDSQLKFPTVARDSLHRFKVYGHQISMLPEYQADAEKFQSLFESNKAPLDLLEPFGRIEEALLEAHPATKAA